MPSHKHELLLELFRNSPTLATDLLQSALRVELPRYTAARVHSTDLTEVRPVEHRADYVLQLVADEKPVFGIIVEVQLSRDSNKSYAWPAYVTNLRRKLRCPVQLLVLTPSQSVARWAAKPIYLGDGNTFTPRVIGPSDVPVIDKVKQARAHPEFAVLSAIAHSKDPDVVKVNHIAAAAIASCNGIDSERSRLYFDSLYDLFGKDIQRRLPEMVIANYQYQSSFARKYYGQGLAKGLADGSRQTLKSVTTKLLRSRFGPLKRAVLSRIAAASSAELEAITERLLVAPTLEEALGLTGKRARTSTQR